MVHRIFVSKGTDANLLKEIREFLNIDLKDISSYLRYDVDQIEESLFQRALTSVFSTVQTDEIVDEVKSSGTVFAIEYLPGQFDQRADSAAQCVQLLGMCKRPLIRCATVYCLEGTLTQAEIATIKHFLINPVESREASLEKVDSLEVVYPAAEDVIDIKGFNEMDAAALAAFRVEKGLAMDDADLALFQAYFREQGRDPSETELKVVDTYWSDHCRHTTFSTKITDAKIADEKVKKTYETYLNLRKKMGRTKNVCLMDLATFGARSIDIPAIDVSKEINACTVKTTVEENGVETPYLLLFKNETHNHPTEIEPFGGAATCIGGAIRDPLSGRAYVHQAMRIAGCGNPLEKVEDTIEGKLPQRKLAQTAANGNSSYGNQIGLATGLVEEIYHDGYKAKHMELGAVIAAVPQENVVREEPEAGDLVILLGGKTGRDGCGGATGSSKSHDSSSLATCGSEVQKGNAPEERKLQRLFRNKKASLLIKRCNDFGAGGVSVAIGELADGLEINLDKVPTKYAGLDGTELAISESQERMAIVVAAKDAATFMAYADEENLESTIVATVTKKPSLVLFHRGRKVVDIDRAFLDTNGAEKQTTVEVAKEEVVKQADTTYASLEEEAVALFSSLDCCSRQGCSERFDSTIGSGSLLMPWGGKYQKSPEQVMASKFPVLTDTEDCTVMSYGFDPHTMETTPYSGAYNSVITSITKAIAAGGELKNTWLTLQEYFGKTDEDPKRWGRPFAALLGALQAQLDMGIAAIGGKDSMSGTFNEMDVPNTLVSFAVSTSKAPFITPSLFTKAGSKLVLFTPKSDAIRESLSHIEELTHNGTIRSSFALGRHGLMEAIGKMSFGNRIGCTIESDVDLHEVKLGQILLECDPSFVTDEDLFVVIGETCKDYTLTYGEEKVSLEKVEAASDKVLESVFPRTVKKTEEKAEVICGIARKPVHGPHIAKPTFILPVFPGTNCEYDSARAIEQLGGKAEIFVVNNQNAHNVIESAKAFADRLKEAQVLFLPGGFSGGDEPDGSGKFIVNFLKSQYIKEQVEALLNERQGLALGICNGFQALIKLGLVPYGKIMDTTKDDPTLTFNNIKRHQSRLVRTRICTTASPWLSEFKEGDVTMAPISHGEGRFVCNDEVLASLIQNGQVAAQYCDLDGKPSMDIAHNPNGSINAIESIISPDGRVLGKMAHSERNVTDLYLNTPCEKDNRLFLGAIKYFK